jgi:hypothetical protein
MAIHNKKGVLVDIEKVLEIAGALAQYAFEEDDGSFVPWKDLTRREQEIFKTKQQYEEYYKLLKK